MNKSIIGWVLAGIVLFACLVVIAGGGYFAYDLNTKLTKTTGDLAAANETISKKTSDLDKANKNITKLNGDVKDAQDKAAGIQVSLDDMTSEKSAIESKFNATVCKKSVSLDYSSYDTARNGLKDFANTLPEVRSIDTSSITYGFDGLADLWTLELVFTKSDNSKMLLEFYIFPKTKSTFFGNDGCWLQTPA
jgi:hypothetical protein